MPVLTCHRDTLPTACSEPLHYPPARFQAFVTSCPPLGTSCPPLGIRNS
jgi:hypothetical protein